MTTKTELIAENSGTGSTQGGSPASRSMDRPAIQMNMPSSSGAGNGNGQVTPQPDKQNNIEDLLLNLMSRLDENDRRYGAALKSMNQRLLELGNQAQGADRSGPEQSVAALERVEKKASTLAEHIAAAERLHNAHKMTSPQELAQKISIVSDEIDFPGQDNSEQHSDPDPETAVNDDFADVTKNLEDSLAIHVPASEFDNLASRMDELANRFDAALNTRNNTEALEKIDAQLNTLTDSFSGAHQQHARLETIESHLNKLLSSANSTEAYEDKKTDASFDALELALKALNDNACEMDSRTAGTLETINTTLQSLSTRMDKAAQLADAPKQTHKEAPPEDYPDVWRGNDSSSSLSLETLIDRQSAPGLNQLGATIPDYQPLEEHRETTQPQPGSIAAHSTDALPPETEPETEPETQNDFIASAQRAATAADAQGSPASPLKADSAHFPAYERSSVRSETKRQRPLLVMAAVGLLLVSAGLLYSRLKTTSDTPAENGSALMAPQNPSSSSAPPSDKGKSPPNPSDISTSKGKKQHSGRLPVQNGAAPSGITATPAAVRISRAIRRTSADEMAAQTLTKPNSAQPMSTATLLASLSRDKAPEPMSGVSISIKEATTRGAPLAGPSLVPPANTKTPAAPLDQPRLAPAPASAAPIPANNIASAMPPATIGPQSLRMAAARGNPAAQVEVASRYARGSGVAQNMAKAYEWFKRAAAQGYAPGQYHLAALHERGKAVKQDIGMAQTWYRRAAELGNVRAMHNLAVLHTRSGGKGPDYTAAKNWFIQGANYGLADSQFNLGILYEQGLGVQKNIAEAYKWFTLAARQGDNGAQKRREMIRPLLSANALRAVENILKSWKASPVKQAANRTGPPKGGWQNVQSEKMSDSSNPASIARAQYLLNKLGYDAGMPDGKMGPKTAAAIRKFEGKTGNPKTGRVSPVLLRRLGVLSG